MISLHEFANHLGKNGRLGFLNYTTHKETKGVANASVTFHFRITNEEQHEKVHDFLNELKDAGHLSYEATSKKWSGDGFSVTHHRNSSRGAHVLLMAPRQAAFRHETLEDWIRKGPAETTDTRQQTSRKRAANRAAFNNWKR